MSISAHIDMANAGDQVVIDWLTWQCEVRDELGKRFDNLTANIIASEQVFQKSAKGFCYLCGHKTQHRQTTGITFPAVASKGFICEKCDA